MQPSRMVFHMMLAALLMATGCKAVVSSPPLITKGPHPGEEFPFRVPSCYDDMPFNFTIECEADGEPAPTYRWTKNGKDLNWQTTNNRISMRPGRGGLVFTSPTEDDEGIYQCFATNSWGVATSESARVRKSFLGNAEVADSYTLLVYEGEPATLICQPPNSYPRGHVTWLAMGDRSLRSVESSRITVGPDGSLHFSSVDLLDESSDFIYGCMISSTFLGQIKIVNKVHLSVLRHSDAAIQINHKPEPQYLSRRNTVVLENHTLRLWCIFSGTPVPTIRWKKINRSTGSDSLPTWAVYENHGKTLLIQNVTVEDEGQYECEATNESGPPRSHVMKVVVQSSPYFERGPEVEIRAEGETAKFYCEIGGRPPPVTHWTYNGENISDVPPNPCRLVESNKLIIFNVTKADIGNYGCRAVNTHNYVYQEAYLNILALPPEITTPLDSKSIVDGQDVTLSCGVIGAPRPHVTWFRDEDELVGRRHSVTEDGDLFIENVSFQDGGQYTCIATNKFGSEVSKGHLTVKERTIITQRPVPYEIAVGQQATFRCNAAADSGLELRIEWLATGEPINFEQDPRFQQQPDYSLTITKTAELDSGVYTCVASTELDKVTASATLVVQDVPNPPVLLTVACNDRYASVAWQPMGDNRAPILGYIIQYNTSFTPDTWENAFDSVPATSTQFSINLSPWTNYTVRVIARNKIGPSLPSDHSEMCTTPPDVPHKNPERVKGKGSTPHNLVIEWSPMTEIDHNGPGFKYRVSHKLDDDWNAHWQTNEVYDWQQDHLVIPHQPTFKPYRIKVEACNNMGQAHVAAQEVVGWSGEDVPTDAPDNLTLLEIKKDGIAASISWTPVSEDSLRGHFMGYKVRTWTEYETKEEARDIIVHKYSHSGVLVKTLVPFTRNFVSVLAFNSEYDGPPSPTVNFLTPEGKPGPVEVMDAIPMGSSAFYLIWKKPKQPNGILLGYRIYFQEVNGTMLGERFELDPRITDPLVTRAKLAFLKPGTNYRVTIRAETAAGQGTPYFIERRTTSEGQSNTPGKPSFIWQHTYTRRGMPAIKVTWIPDASNMGAYFYLKYKLYTESTWQVTDIEYYKEFIVLENLEHGQTYNVILVAMDGEYSTESDMEEIDMTILD